MEFTLSSELKGDFSDATVELTLISASKNVTAVTEKIGSSLNFVAPKLTLTLKLSSNFISASAKLIRDRDVFEDATLKVYKSNSETIDLKLTGDASRRYFIFKAVEREGTLYSGGREDFDKDAFFKDATKFVQDIKAAFFAK